MKSAILFWFYKSPALCRSRLKLIRRYNPDVPVFGLYGGPFCDAEMYKKLLLPLLDDLYVFDPDQAHSSFWRWTNGDLVLCDWYRQRGILFEWDSLVIIQWDMLIFDHVQNIFGGLDPNEIILSGVKKLTPKLQADWHWTNDSLETHKARFQRFLLWYRENASQSCELFTCHFIAVSAPRCFWDDYSSLDPMPDGFIEYRFPSIAAFLGYRFASRPELDTCWYPIGHERHQTKLLSPYVYPISLMRIWSNRIWKKQPQLIHPFPFAHPDSISNIFLFLRGCSCWVADKIKLKYQHLMRNNRGSRG